MSRKLIFVLIAVILLIGLATGGYFGWEKWKKSKALPGETKTPGLFAAEKITESATKGVLPSININPLESKPNLNPVEKTNPFKKMKTNPFE